MWSGRERGREGGREGGAKERGNAGPEAPSPGSRESLVRKQPTRGTGRRERQQWRQVTWQAYPFPSPPPSLLHRLTSCTSALLPKMMRASASSTRLTWM